MRRATQPPESESPATIRDRGAVGAALLTIREGAAQVVAFIGMLVLAHLLSPTDLGMVAFGTTVVTIGNFFADGGLGAALIRRADHPSVDELRALLALQLILAIVIALAVAIVGFRAGTTGAVTAIMACSLPLLALRAPHAIALERALEYRPIAATEFAESLVFYGWAIATVEAGWGVWGVASAAIARSLAGSVLMTVASPLKRIRPRLVRGALRSMLGFGIGFQAIGLAALARHQGVNLVVVAIGGERLLGYWAVAYRLMQLPFWVLPGFVAGLIPDDGAAARAGRGHARHSGALRPCDCSRLRCRAGTARCSADFVVPALFGANLGSVRGAVALGQRRPAGLRSYLRCRCGLSLLGERRADAARRDHHQWSRLDRPYGDSSSPTGDCGCRHLVDGRFVDRGRALRAGSVACGRRGQQNDPGARCRCGRVRAPGARGEDAAFEQPHPRDRDRDRCSRRVPCAQLRVQPCRSRRHRSTSEVAHVNPDRPTTARARAQAPLFLVGSERSGTTFLRLMLDHHPEIAFEKEFDFVVTKVSDAGEFRRRTTTSIGSPPFAGRTMRSTGHSTTGRS